MIGHERHSPAAIGIRFIFQAKDAPVERGGEGGFVVVLSGVVLKSTRWVQARRILFGYFNIIREVNLFGLGYTGILVLSWFYHCFIPVVGSSKLPLVERLVGLGGEIPS